MSRVLFIGIISCAVGMGCPDDTEEPAKDTTSADDGSSVEDVSDVLKDVTPDEQVTDTSGEGIPDAPGDPGPEMDQIDHDLEVGNCPEIVADALSATMSSSVCWEGLGLTHYENCALGAPEDIVAWDGGLLLVGVGTGGLDPNENQGGQLSYQQTHRLIELSADGAPQAIIEFQPGIELVAALPDGNQLLLLGILDETLALGGDEGDLVVGAWSGTGTTITWSHLLETELKLTPGSMVRLSGGDFLVRYPKSYADSHYELHVARFDGTNASLVYDVVEPGVFVGEAASGEPMYLTFDETGPPYDNELIVLSATGSVGTTTPVPGMDDYMPVAALTTDGLDARVLARTEDGKTVTDLVSIASDGSVDWTYRVPGHFTDLVSLGDQVLVFGEDQDTYQLTMVLVGDTGDEVAKWQSTLPSQWDGTVLSTSPLSMAFHGESGFGSWMTAAPDGACDSGVFTPPGN